MLVRTDSRQNRRSDGLDVVVLRSCRSLREQAFGNMLACWQGHLDEDARVSVALHARAHVGGHDAPCRIRPWHAPETRDGGEKDERR